MKLMMDKCIRNAQVERCVAVSIDGPGDETDDGQMDKKRAGRNIALPLV